MFARVLGICQNEPFISPDRIFSLISPTPAQQAEFLQDRNFRLSHNSGMSMRSKLAVSLRLLKHFHCKNYGCILLYSVESRHLHWRNFKLHEPSDQAVHRRTSKVQIVDSCDRKSGRNNLLAVAQGGNTPFQQRV